MTTLAPSGSQSLLPSARAVKLTEALGELYARGGGELPEDWRSVLSGVKTMSSTAVEAE